jgi:sulfate/thiosulfate transport system permease protein
MLSGNVPFSTEVSSVHIYSQIQSDYVTGAAAGSIVLLSISLIVLMSITGLQRWSSKHER